MNEILKAGRGKRVTRDRSKLGTRALILEKAEELFAAKGIEGTSIRDISAVAGVNLAAINYHFGTKEGLVKALFLSRMEPMEQRRRQLLDEAEEKTRRSRVPLTIEAVLKAFVLPMIEQGYHKRSNQAFFKMLGRSFGEPNKQIHDLVRQYADETRRRFDAALISIFPHLQPDEFFWKINFTMGAIHHSLLSFAHVASLRRKPSYHPTLEDMMRWLIPYASAGFQAGPSL